MADVYLVHWDEAEARERALALESAGHRVRVHWSTERAARIDPLPDALVVSLDRLPPLHKDPFDRILIAQALVEGITLVTRDEQIEGYPGSIMKV